MSELHELCGWASDIAQVEAVRMMSANPNLFVPARRSRFYGQTFSKPIFELAKAVRGSVPAPKAQETGDCVSWGAKHAMEYLAYVQEVLYGQPVDFRRIFAPYVYATSRCEPDTGNGQLGRSPGSTGAWAVTAMKKYGILFEDDPSTPAYSGAVADEWGYSGAPSEAKQHAKDNPLITATKLSSVEEIRDALLDYKPCTYAVMWRYDTEQHVYEGYPVMKSGRTVGGHQVCLLHWIDKPFRGAYILNSWGDRVHGGASPNGEPPGGAYAHEEQIQEDITSGQSEVYALSLWKPDRDDSGWGF